jgi:hypothetical protein
MGQIEYLLDAYSRFVAIPWTANLSGAERVWMLIYPPREERRLRMRISEFETETCKAGHGWKLEDVTDSFPEWLSENENRETYFEDPELLEPALERFAAALSERVRASLAADEVEDSTVVALLGVGSLFGLTRVSFLLEQVESHIRGRLLVFFPGERQGNNYRLLDGRDGWNYRATPITAYEEHPL